MGKYKKKKLNIYKVSVAVIILLLLIIGPIKLFNHPKKALKMIDLVNQDVASIKDALAKYDLDISFDYKYDDDIKKDKVISQSIPKDAEIEKGDKVKFIISLGKIDKAKLKSDDIDELGKVPIMMYHGIKNVKNSETDYTGGNVDKDGYTRTAEAFRNDLEFYYKNGYRMIRLTDYVNGNINTEYGKSPIILTFDDGNDNNIKVTGLDSDGNIIIDKNSAVGILEEYKKKYPDFNVTAIFFVTGGLFNQSKYNDKIIKWLVDNGYDVGNHTKGHHNLKEITESETEEVIGYVYDKLEGIIGDKYQKIVALPFGTPYSQEHANFKHIISGEYNGKKYQTLAALRVGWEPEVSPYNKDFNPTFLKRCRAYDNNGKDFDIEMVFKNLEKNRYISDGNAKTIVTSIEKKDIVSDNYQEKEIILYE